MLNLQNIDLVNSTSDQVKVMSYSFFIWTSIFAIINQRVHLKNHPKKVQDDIKNRIVSIIHGALTFWAAAYIVLVEQPSFGAANSQTMQFTMIISASYFVYDFLACLYYDLADMSLVSHHSLAICGYAVATFSKFGAPSSIWGLMSAEVSNFPMHIRVILRQVGLRHTKLYEACEWTYFALYIIFRGSLVPYMVWNTWPESEVPLLVKITATGLFLQSVYFIFEMKKILTRQYFQYQERKKKNIHHYWFRVNQRIYELQSFQQYLQLIHWYIREQQQISELYHILTTKKKTKCFEYVFLAYINLMFVIIINVLLIFATQTQEQVGVHKVQILQGQNSQLNYTQFTCYLYTKYTETVTQIE